MRGGPVWRDEEAHIEHPIKFGYFTDDFTIECIIVNDGSRDHVGAIVERYAENVATNLFFRTEGTDG